MDIAAEDHAWRLNQVIQEDAQIQWSARDTSSPLCGPMVSIFAGPNRTHFMVHIKIMCSQSLYFVNRFNTISPPSKADLNLQFPKVDPKDMALFTSSVYRLFWKEPKVDTGATPDELIVENIRLYLISVSFEARSLQEEALSIVRLYIHAETATWVHSLSAVKFEAYLKTRLELIRVLYGATDKRNDPLRMLFVGSLGSHSDDYFDCGAKYGISIDGDLTALFASTPEFAEDLERLLSERRARKWKGVTIMAPLIEEDESKEADGQYCGGKGGINSHQ